MMLPAAVPKPAHDDVVLVVDDDPGVASAMAEALEDDGHAVVVAHTGAEARRRLAERPIALLLLDLRLPDLDGLALLREVRERASAPDVVVVTGHASIESAIEAIEAGAGGYVEKPVDFVRLRRVVARLLERRRLVRENQALVEQLDARSRQAEVLYAVSATLASTLDFGEALRRLCRELARLFGADTVSSLVHDVERDLLVPSAAYHAPKEHAADLARLAVPIRAEGFSPSLWDERKPVASDDVAHDPRFAHEVFRAFPHQSALVLPLVIDGEVAGAFYLVWWRARRVFTGDELRLAEQLCGQVSLFVRNARLFEEIERQRRRLAEIFDSTSDGMLLVGRDGQIASANRRAGELLGFDHAAAGGLGLTGVLARHFADETEFHAAVNPLRAAVEDGRDAEGDLDLPASGRTVRWAARPAGALSHASSVTLTDVTQEREVSRMKSDFVSFVTHQLRTPLAGIKWLLELGSQTLARDAEAASYVSDAREAAERLIRLVNELLDVSRLESGRVKIAPAVVDLGELTSEVIAELGGAAKDRGQRFTIEAAGAPRIVVDRQLIRQVLMNLLSNAIKYTPAGGAITVRIAARADGVAWTVQDTGIGIPAEAAGRLFEKFYRAPNGLAIETEGTGLGLYLTKLIVERFDGRVWCQSAEGEGSTFGFVVPV